MKTALDKREEKIFDFENRLVRFAAECVKFTKTLYKNYENEYYKGQLIRSSGSSALNYGEAPGTMTKKDFIHKGSLTKKELKESRTSLKILEYLNEGNSEDRAWLLEEVEELIAICSRMVNNKMNVSG